MAKSEELRADFWRRGAESNRRIEVLQTSALPLGYRALEQSRWAIRKAPAQGEGGNSGAGDGGRTRDFDLGKVALYH